MTREREREEKANGQGGGEKYNKAPHTFEFPKVRFRKMCSAVVYDRRRKHIVEANDTWIRIRGVDVTVYGVKYGTNVLQ